MSWDRPTIQALTHRVRIVTELEDYAGGLDSQGEALAMPMGILWLAVGIGIGSVAGLLLFDQLIVGAAAGFVIVLVLLLVGNWLGGRGRDEDDIRISG